MELISFASWHKSLTNSLTNHTKYRSPIRNIVHLFAHQFAHQFHLLPYTLTNKSPHSSKVRSPIRSIRLFVWLIELHLILAHSRARTSILHLHKPRPFASKRPRTNTITSHLRCSTSPSKAIYSQQSCSNKPYLVYGSHRRCSNHVNLVQICPFLFEMCHRDPKYPEHTLGLFRKKYVKYATIWPISAQICSIRSSKSR